MAEKDRGFASMPAHKRREIASKGGKSAHAKGVAHEWTSEEASAAGRKGGKVAHQRKVLRDANRGGLDDGAAKPLPAGYPVPDAAPKVKPSGRLRQG